MKAILIMQQWALLVTMGLKIIETGSGVPVIVERFLINASNGKSRKNFCRRNRLLKKLLILKKPFGAIMGEVDIVNVLRKLLVNIPKAGMHGFFENANQF